MRGRSFKVPVIMIGVVIGIVLTMALGVALALFRPESTSILRPWWR